MKVVGWFVLGFGVVLILVGFVIDPSVPTSGGAINNIGLLNTKSNLVVAGAGAAVVGAILALIGEIQELAPRGFDRTPGSPTLPASASAEHFDAQTVADDDTLRSEPQNAAPDRTVLDQAIIIMMVGIGVAVILAAIYSLLF